MNRKSKKENGHNTVAPMPIQLIKGWAKGQYQEIIKYHCYDLFKSFDESKQSYTFDEYMSNHPFRYYMQSLNLGYEKLISDGELLYQKYNIKGAVFVYMPYRIINSLRYSTKAKACLLYAMALRSIVGSRSVVKTNNNEIWARMCGYSSARQHKTMAKIQNIEYEKDTGLLPEEFATYNSRYHFKQFRDELEQQDFAFNYWSIRVHGMWVSFNPNNNRQVLANMAFEKTQESYKKIIEKNKADKETIARARQYYIDKHKL